MKKIIGSKIFTFILGGIFFSTISVIATKAYDASQISYGNTTVDQALNNLYTSASASSYTPSGHVTPSTSTQTLETENKRVTSNIVIDPIPSNYNNISDTTITSASDIVSGKIAYKADGTKITGILNTAALNNFTVSLISESYSTRYSNALVYLTSGTIYSQYKYFKINSITSTVSSGNTSTMCKATAMASATGREEDLAINTEYQVYSSTDGHKYRSLYSRTASGTDGKRSTCEVNVTFYNK